MTLLGGTILSPGGTPVTGSLYLQLSQNATLIAGGALVVAQPPFIFNLTAGVISGPGLGPYSVPGADALTPSGLTYFMSVTGPSGELVFEKNVLITGTSANLGTLPPAVPPFIIPIGTILTGDVIGPTSQTKVVGIQGVSVVATPPTSGQALMFNGASWAPATPSALPTFTPGAVPFGGVSGILTQDPSNLFFNDASNSLGIGTASPAGILHVMSGLAGAWFSTTDFAITTTGSALEIFHGGTGDQAARIQAIKSGGSAQADLVLQPNGGNVGIGTIPTSPLHITAGPGELARFNVLGTGGAFLGLDSTGANCAIGMESGAGGSLMVGSLPNSSFLQSVGATALHLGTTNITRFTILAGGNVGIGTVAPAQKLSVVGTIEITAGSGGGVKFADGTIQTTAAVGSGGTVTSVAMSGGTTGLTFAGGPITSSGTFTAGGTLAVANGGTGNATAAVPAGNLTGTTLAANVVNSSLTSVGTLATLTVTAPIVGSITGNAATATTAAVATKVTAISGAATTGFVTFVSAATGAVNIATDAGFVYNSVGPGLNTLTCDIFIGKLTGNVTGNVSGSAGSSAFTLALGTTGAAVNVSLAAPPTIGQTLVATSATTATWQTLSGGGPATALATTGLAVNVSLAAPPTIGQTLVATSATTATWQTLSGGGGVTSVNVAGGTTGLTFTGGPITTSGTITAGGTLAVASGGTGTATAFTQGSVHFAGVGGAFAQDNANFFWDSATKALGIGTNAPGSPLTVRGAGQYLIQAGATTATWLGMRLFDSTTSHQLGCVIDTAAGGTIITGSLPFSSNFGSVQNDPVHLFANSFAKVTLLTSGNVGIGTTAPAFPLQIVGGGTSTVSQLAMNAAGSGTLSALCFAAGTQSIMFDADWTASTWVARHTSAYGIGKTTGLFQITGNAGLTSGNTFGPTALFTVDATNFYAYLAGGVKLGVGTATPGSPVHIVNAAGGGMMRLSGGTTNAEYIQTDNTGASLLVGIESSSAGSLMVGGLAYTSFFQSVGATPVQIGTANTARITILGTGNVGIGTNAPGTNLDIGTGSYASRPVNLNVSSGTNNDLTLPNGEFFVIVGPGAAATITGLTNGVNGKKISMTNSTGFNVTLSFNNSGSGAANRFLINNAADIVLRSYDSAILQYNVNAWYCIGKANV